MKKILITGGAGFIGSNFAHYIYDKYPDYAITVVDLLTYAGSVENLPAPAYAEDKNHRFEFVYGNVTNGELMDALVSEADFVVHFAAESHVTRSIFDTLQFFQTDVLGTQAVANAVYRYKNRVTRFVHISTSEVYGTALTERMGEDHPLNPMSPYASAKAGADRLVYSYHSTYKIPSVILRPFNNYGPRQHLEKVLPRFITCGLLNETMKVHGGGHSSRDFIHVSDTCRAIDMLLHAPAELVVGETFNAGSGQSRSIASLAREVSAILGIAGKYSTEVGDRPGQVERHTADYDKIKRALGWEPLVKWEEGLRDTVEWYRTHEAWWRKQLWLREIPIVTVEGNREYH